VSEADDYGLSDHPSWRSVDWTAHLQRAEVADASVAYLDIGEGDGPPVVLVHGLGGRWSNWLENIPALARERRVVALDLPGFGDSGMPAEEISVSGYARVVDGLCEQLGLGPVVVVGNSMGGFVAAELAVAFPERVERLVLVDAAGMVPGAGQRRRSVAVLELTGFLGARLAASYRSVAARPRLRRLALGMVAHRPERLSADLVLEGLLTPISPAYRQALHATLGYLSWDWAERLRTVRAPTLVVWGDRDALIPVGHGEEYARRIAGARSLVLADTGHIPMVERPRSFNRALLEFLAEPGSPPQAVGAA
jgi:pimeloyl-ACP methyl ester carboxylesterase